MEQKNVSQSRKRKRSAFTGHLVRANRLDKHGFCGWHWQPGMLFGDDTAWWGARSLRPRPHEGLDLRAFTGGDDAPVFVAPGLLIPALFKGTVVAICPDFLAQSIVVAHQKRQDGGRLYSVYAHVTVEPGVAKGYSCQAGEIIARIAPSPKPDLPPHLHLSLFWLTGALPEPMSWPALHESPALHFCDPLPFLAARAPRQTNKSQGTKWQIYIVACRDGTLYTGITTDLDRRLTEHNEGSNGARYTRTRRPVRLMYSEPAASRSAAARREWQIKQMSAAQKMALTGQGKR